ncbi:L,D-transpeptidase [Salegentibacter sp. HM20]
MKSTFSYFIFYLSLVILTGLQTSCRGEKSSGKDEVAQNKTAIQTQKDSVVELEETIIKYPRYSKDSIKSIANRDSIFQRLSAVERNLILSLNRIDLYRLQPGELFIMPDSLSENFLWYSPFPAKMPLLDSIPKAVLISQRIQAFAAYENGNLCRWGAVSSGKQSTPTPNGLHYANYKARRKISTVNRDWIMPYYVNFMNFYGVGSHEYNLPGFPASHACVRMFREDAIFIYNWIQTWELENNAIKYNGTPYFVFGEYNYEAEKPWLQLADDPQANFLLPAEKDTLKIYVEKYKQEPKNFRSTDSIGKDEFL